MRTGGWKSPQERALEHVAAQSAGGPIDSRLRLTMNFHPDRSTAGQPILGRMAEIGFYQSQFVTGTSNGGLSAHPGGDRWRWESRIFGGAYDKMSADQRPVYGALNFRSNPVGGAPRFGSSYLRLTADTLSRATFCYPDSSTDPADFGVAERFSLIELARADSLDDLDGHIEAQIHGTVRFDRDVEALVLDPSYRGTTVQEMAEQLPCPLEWHPGFRLHAELLHHYPDFRGRRYVDLGVEISAGGRLDPKVIGDAARTGHYDVQDLKKVWHYLAGFGAPRPPARNAFDVDPEPTPVD